MGQNLDPTGEETEMLIRDRSREGVRDLENPQQMAKAKINHQIKIVMVGSYGVGKSSLVQAYVSQTHKPHIDSDPWSIKAQVTSKYVVYRKPPRRQ